MTSLADSKTEFISKYSSCLNLMSANGNNSFSCDFKWRVRPYKEEGGKTIKEIWQAFQIKLANKANIML